MLLAVLAQPIPPVLTDGLERPVAWQRGAIFERDERLVDQVAEEGDRVADRPVSDSMSSMASSGAPPTNTDRSRSIRRCGSVSRL